MNSSQTGRLTLVPTPIAPDVPLDEYTRNAFLKAVENPTFYWWIVEERSAAERRWVSWGLPRTVFPRFVELNEHSDAADLDRLAGLLKNGAHGFLMSDAGLPAFCDPGRELIDRCHRGDVPVGSLPFANSLMLALVLSGFVIEPFWFRGFLPQKTEDRIPALRDVCSHSEAIALMDTPYRLEKTIAEIAESTKRAGQENRWLFLAAGLNDPSSEVLIRCRANEAPTAVEKLTNRKIPFVIVLAPLGTK